MPVITTEELFSETAQGTISTEELFGQPPSPADFIDFEAIQPSQQEVQQNVQSAEELAIAGSEKGEIGFLENIKRKGQMPGRGGFDITTAPGMEEAEIIRYAIIGDKIKKGTATEEETQLLSSYLGFLQEEASRGKTIPAKVYDIVSQIPKFGLEFLATGGAYTGVKEGAKKALGKVVKNELTKNLVGVVAGTAARTALMPHKAAAYAAREQLFEGEENVAKSIAKGFGDTYIENLSEVSGEGISKVAGSIAGKMVKYIPVDSAIGKLIKAIPEKEIVRRIQTGLTQLKKIGYNGTVEEFLEERFGDTLRAITGLGEWSDVIPSGEQAATEIAAFAVPGAVNIALAGIPQGKAEILAKEIAEGKKETFSRKDFKELFGIDRSTAEERQQKFDEVKTELTAPLPEQPAVIEPKTEAMPEIEPETAAPPTAKIKIMITKADEQALRDLGYKQEQIDAMRPDEAGSIIEHKTAEKPAENIPKNIPKITETTSSKPLKNKGLKTKKVRENSPEIQKAIKETTDAIVNHDLYRIYAEASEESERKLPLKEYVVAATKADIPAEIKEYIGKPGQKGYKGYLWKYIKTRDEAGIGPSSWDEAMGDAGLSGAGEGDFIRALDDVVQGNKTKGRINEKALNSALRSNDHDFVWQAAKLGMLKRGFTLDEIEQERVQFEKDIQNEYETGKLPQGTDEVLAETTPESVGRETTPQRIGEESETGQIKADDDFSDFFDFNEKPIEKPNSQKTFLSKEKADQYKKDIMGGGLASGIDPIKFAKLLYIGGYHLERSSRDFGRWSKNMIAELGEKIKPHLEKIWNEISKKSSEELHADIVKLVEKNRDLKTPTKPAEATKEIPAQTKVEPEKSAGPAGKATKKTDSVIAGLIASDLSAEGIEANLEYTPIKIKDEVAKAEKLAFDNPEEAKTITYGGENTTGINANAVRLAHFYQAAKDENWKEAERAANRVISANTQAGQDIAVNKGFITEASPMKFIKQVAAKKMEKAAKKFGKDGIKKIAEKVKHEAGKVREKLTLAQMKIKDAQDFIESLKC